MNVEKARFKNPRTLMVSLAAKMNNLAGQEHLGQLRLERIGNVIMEKGEEVLINHMNSEDKSRLDNLLNSSSEYYPIKYLGNIALQEVTRAGFDYYDPKTNFRLRKGESYLAIHITDDLSFESVISKKIGESMGRVRRSMNSVAEYIKLNKERLPKGPLVGITYAQLAKASERFGFTVAETSLPKRAEKYYAEKLKLIDPEMAEKYPGVSLCFQSLDEVAKKFSIQSQPQREFEVTEIAA